MQKLSDLAKRADFNVGPLFISPSRRLVRGPGGESSLEPLIMQVFLLLLDARGGVVTRDQLFEQVWGGVIVGDDSLNRAIAKARRIDTEVGPGILEIETIPRTGYRMVGAVCEFNAGPEDAVIGQSRRISRRILVGSGAALAVAGAAGLFWAGRDHPDPRVSMLLEEGRKDLREGLAVARLRAVETFRKAVALDPDRAEAWGLLAYAQAGVLEIGLEQKYESSIQAAEQAAGKSLAIDPRDPHALLAMLILKGDMMDWASREDEYRRILRISPQNSFALYGLGMQLHGSGRCRESYAFNERALAIAPMSPNYRMRKAMRAWVLGRVGEADRVSDRSMELWPSHRLVRLARLIIYSFTGRPRAALAMIEEEESRPLLLSPAAASVWRVSLEALENPTRQAISAATAANVDGAKSARAIAANAILVLSALQQLDAAFEVASGFLLSQGSIIVRSGPAPNPLSMNASGWRNTFGLFTPPTAAMRRHALFGPLADGLGLTQYWRLPGRGPDAFLFRA